MQARRHVSLRGTQWLVFSPACWRLHIADGHSARDTHATKRLDIAVGSLSGELLDGLAIYPRTGHTEFFFDLGGRITVRWPVALAADGEAVSPSISHRIIWRSVEAPAG